MELAIDVGGTFTDLVCVDHQSGSIHVLKYPTDRDALADGVRRCLEESGIDIAALSAFTHGTTVAINSLIERKGVPTALITTEGARDVYSIGRGNRPIAYDIFFERPRPLVTRDATIEVHERLYASGEVRTELTDAEVERAVDRVARLGVEAVAICLLHSYANPEHEQRLARAIGARLPEVYVTTSSDVLRQYREYERTSTTVVNSYVGPPVANYLRQLADVLRDKGFRGALRIMQSNGGVCGLPAAMRRPVALLESGPVAGIAAASRVAQRLGITQVVAFDMGGTTAKASLSDDGAARVAEGYYVGGYASGQPVMLPVVDVIEIGSGGGSLAGVDGQGRLYVGPASAGANPGPACYRRGGVRPTVTDADLVLGRIGGGSFLGGRMPLDRAAAVRAIDEHVGRPLGLTTEQAAGAIVAIAVDRMTLAVREVSVANGVDPRECSMVAFGGAGPVHAVEIARELGIPTVVVPNYPSQFSAYGMLMTGVRHDYVRTHLSPLAAVDWSAVEQIKAELLVAADADFVSDGLDPASMVAEFSAELRFVGQESVLPVRLGEATGQAAAEELAAGFTALHEKLYGHHASKVGIEMVNLKLSAHVPANWTGSTPRRERPHEPETRRMYFPKEALFREVVVVRRGGLAAGAEIAGPALIEEPDTTTFIGIGDVARVVPDGELLVSVHSAAESRTPH